MFRCSSVSGLFNICCSLIEYVLLLCLSLCWLFLCAGIYQHHSPPNCVAPWEVSRRCPDRHVSETDDDFQARAARMYESGCSVVRGFTSQDAVLCECDVGLVRIRLTRANQDYTYYMATAVQRCTCLHRVRWQTCRPGMMADYENSFINSWCGS